MRKVIAFIALLLGPFVSSAAQGEGAATFPPIAGWKVLQDSTVYTPANLYDLIDGAADLFLSYGFVDLHLAEYTLADSPSVRVEVYRHSTATNAFGIYSQERNTDYSFIPVGTEGYIEDGVLNFLAGTHYIKLSTMAHGEPGRRMMTTVAKNLAAVLATGHSWPEELAFFPQEGKIAHSEVYSAENFLGYRFLRDTFSAGYGGKEPFMLFVTRTESKARAGELLGQYARAVGDSLSHTGETLREFVDPHTGRVALKQRGRYLLGIVRYARQETALQMVRLLEERVGESPAAK